MVFCPGVAFTSSWGEQLVDKLSTPASNVVLTHHVTRRNMPIHNIISTAQLSVSQKALGTPPVDGNVMPKHVGATIHN
jgi:hypothetical protein